MNIGRIPLGQRSVEEKVFSLKELAMGAVQTRVYPDLCFDRERQIQLLGKGPMGEGGPASAVQFSIYLCLDKNMLSVGARQCAAPTWHSFCYALFSQCLALQVYVCAVRAPLIPPYISSHPTGHPMLHLIPLCYRSSYVTTHPTLRVIPTP
jgi:hypothetical protein